MTSAEASCNALSIDVEDYFQVSAFASHVAPESWPNYSPRVARNTYRLLELFDKRGVKATFFVLGWVGERNPELVEAIHKAGHEVACHGYSHTLIYLQTAEQFRAETRRAKRLLEDIIAAEVTGYRAASFSIVSSCRWALDVLAEEGFRYDSSIYPIHHDRYGMREALTDPHRLTTPGGNRLVEFPPTAAAWLGLRMPVGGGGYFRLYPYAVTRAALRSVNRNGRRFMCYLHPWEIDPRQPRLRGSLASRFRHYVNLRHTEPRLMRLLSDFHLAPVAQVLRQLQLLPPAPADGKGAVA